MPHKERMEQIKASAGSGKTYTLTLDFLSALCRTDKATCADSPATDGPAADWRSIMAITFTNAAAGEMQDRVLRMLKETALGISRESALMLKEDEDARETAERAGHWLDVILRDRSNLNISTIDSLLNLILRLSALGMDLPPNFQPVFSNEDLVKPCWEQYCNEAWQGDPEARRLIAAICRSIVSFDGHNRFSSNDAVLDRLIEVVNLMVRDRLDPADLSDDAVFLQPDGRGLLPRLRQTVFMTAERLVKANGTPSADGEKPIVYDGRFTTALTKICGKFTDALGNVPSDQAGLADYAKVWKQLSKEDQKPFQSAYLSKSGVTVTTKSGPVPDELEAAYQDLCAAAADLLRLEHMHSQQRSLRPLLVLAENIANRCEAQAREEGLVLNERVPMLVRRALDGEYGVAEALCRMGTRISHFLVDEFQDTSRDHWEALKPLVVEALSQGGSFTWVGDVKQAIYGFRGGDSQLFDDVLRDPELTCLLENGPKCSSLDMNWRSRREIFQFNNDLFTPLQDEAFCRDLLRGISKEMAERMDVCGDVPELRAGGAPRETTIVDWMAGKMARAYQGVKQEDCPRTRGDGSVMLLSFPSSDGQAEAVGSIISKGREKRPWSDFLVLVRSNSQAMDLARHLTSLGMPVVTENSLLVAEHPLIVQTVALRSFLRAPEDDVAFWTLVSGSLLGLYPMRGRPASPAGGGDVSQATSPADAEAEASAPVQAADLDLLAISRARSGAGKGRARSSLSALWRQRRPDAWNTVIEPLLRGGATLTPYNLVSSWYEHTGVFDRWPDAEPFLRRFLEILHTSDQRGLHSLGDFLDFWKEHGDEEKLPMPGKLNAVSIMTVHKSKGLQAKVVIAPWTSRKNPGESELGVVEYRTRSGGTVVRALCRKSSLFASYVHDRTREAFEAVNRFYVAFTRAEEELYVFVSQPSEGDGRLLEKLMQADAKCPSVIPWDQARPDFDPASGATDGAAAASGEEDGHDGAAPALAGTPARETAPDGDAAAPSGTEAGTGAASDGGEAGGTGAGDGPEPEAGTWEPMSWMPRLRLHFGFMDETHPRDVAREEGLFMHGCLEELVRLPREARLGDEAMRACIRRVLLDRSRRAPWLTAERKESEEREDFLERCSQDMTWFSGVARRFGWLDRGLPEQTLTRRRRGVPPGQIQACGGLSGQAPDLRGLNLRMDLYVPGPGRPVVIDYKTGLFEDRFMEEHHRQVLDYIDCLTEAGGPDRPQPVGVVVYLKPRRFHLVLPGQQGGIPSLLDEDAFARAMAGLA